ncbi:calmodulin-binding receptor-like cytoplasmic kinase 2 [Selaginella moellendorffii]|uniref:calmodulin-binding receptor-like cytoplasmic kinase 2 n=1 Tax=Selaginella moellendorffii TaxID=88036 RepID=UPI000D1CA71F|nr:calmodulin-binding receptor-like cytoplasmic kinase 2 [Selaginella moellendorffii]XP_024535188.1 calmodulin-binding receptor-like cytoplasmic kinase 2 [Selaginella moellendorffii]|eukprot:XP_024535182.1 calmodulin-binding receptor-like cytoplasmic kinase 2 [Selaginella moellendorffii]
MAVFLDQISIEGIVLLVFLLGIGRVHCQESDGLDFQQRQVEGYGRKFGRFEQAKVGGGAGSMILVAGSGTLLTCLVLCPCLQAKHKNDKPRTFPKDESSNISKSSSPKEGTSLSSQPASSCIKMSTTGSGALTFTMAELNRITGSFSSSHKIGGGSSGTIYKGKLRDGTLVAVKRAKRDSFETRHTKEFENEVNMLSSIEHLNLVKLVGYHEDERERILVVEYVPNRNLRQHLDDAHNILDFSTRLDIAIDVAHALTYLHQYAEQPIIHRDVKSSNILLTDTCRAKVADFGFSRVGPSDVGATHVSTQVKGTAGYLDPEYLQTYQLTTKSDVYSFGILLMEIFSARRPIELSRPSDERITIRWAFKKFVEGNIQDVLDPALPKNPPLVTLLEMLAELAFKCAAPSRRDRPSMKEAAEILWNIRKEYQATVSQASTPKAFAFETRHSPLPSPMKHSPAQKPLHSPQHSPLRTSMERSPFHKPQKNWS